MKRKQVIKSLEGVQVLVTSHMYHVGHVENSIDALLYHAGLHQGEIGAEESHALEDLKSLTHNREALHLRISMLILKLGE